MQGVKLFDFQSEAVTYLLDTTSATDTKQTVIVKSPTGSGKTMILIDYIDKYLNLVNPNTAFIWFCPGKGDLEMQSKDKMDKYLPSKKTSTIHDSLLDGFEAGTTSFINWELVTKKGNRAISDTERKNLFERVAEAHRKGLEFIVIIDEEHQNNTSKADTIIECFAAKKIVRVSATAKKNKLDFCYLYTFDDNYKETVMQELSHSFETRRLFLKSECKTFSLVKEYRDKDFDGLGERENCRK